MTRTTIDFGIDLGTTNSAIAELNGVSTGIIKNNDDADVTSSAVMYGKNGQVYIGSRAKSGTIDKPDDAYAEFKRQMGTDHAYKFKQSGISKSPEELSSEILKALRSDVMRIREEEINAAVITVPAAFGLHQCDATRKAAQLAGFTVSPLVQEPVAAALAYGFQVESEREYWLVYDFGGGTFDAAIIKAEEGLINVVNHGGDNWLGGSDIDWDIVQKIIVPKLQGNYNLPGFKRGNEKWGWQLRKLKHAVEAAKIELSTKASTSLLGCSFEDEDGNLVDCEDIQLTQSEVISIAEPIVRRSVDICKETLKKANIPEDRISRLVLVGGPTKAPYFRDIIKNSLPISVDHSMDPLTVVAKGAAVFAGTQKIEVKKSTNMALDEFHVDLKYKAVGIETDPMVGGRVSSSVNSPMDGFAIEVTNQKSQWKSGKIPLKTDGSFILNLHAEKGERNVFSIELLDSVGSLKKVSPDNLVYTVGAAIEEQPLIHSLGIALSGNEREVFFKKGDGLPLKKKGDRPFKTINTIKVGEDGSGIIIPIVEGENPKADRNLLIGIYEINSKQIKRDLPAGSDVEITLKIDESRVITINIYIPIFDEEYDFHLDLRKASISKDDLEKDLAFEIERLDKLEGEAKTADQDDIISKINDLRSSSLLQEIRSSIEASGGDAVAANKGQSRLLEFKIQVDAIETLVHWPSITAKIQDWLKDLKALAADHGNPSQKQKASDLSSQVEDAIRRKDADIIEKKQKDVEALYFSILFAQPSFWVNQFRYLETEKSKMNDQAKASRLFDMGRNYISQNNTEGLKQIVQQLWTLTPDDVVNNAQRGFGANLAR